MPQSIRTQIRQAVSSVTGHNLGDLAPEQYLESDLGIDSIKMVDLTQRLMRIVPEAQLEAFSSAIPGERLMQVQTLGEIDAIFDGWHNSIQPGTVKELAACAPGSPAHSPNDLSAVLTTAASVVSDIAAVISGITGHTAADLHVDAYLESDLGIDSIKMVELTQALLKRIPAERREAFFAAVPSEQLMKASTIGALSELLAPWIADNGPSGSPAATGMAHAGPDSGGLPVNTGAEPVDVEILYAQDVFLVGHWAISTCSLCSRVRVEGPFDPGIARQVWNTMLSRHPVLRGRFIIPADATSFAQYRFQIRGSVVAPAMTLTDLRHLGKQQQDAAIADEIERCVNDTWQLDGEYLHRFFILRLSDQVHEVFFTNHHVISDGLSNQQVMREFLELYQAHEAHRPPETTPATSVAQYQEIVSGINSSRQPGDDQALAEFLRSQDRAPFFWNPGNVTRTNQLARCRNYRFHIDEKTTQGLVEQTRALRVPMYTLLVAAYLRAVADFDNMPETIFLNVPTSGRVYPGVDASGIVGCFAQNLVLSFAAPRTGEGWPALVERVHREISTAISSGYDRTQTRQAALTVREKLELVNGGLSRTHASMIRAGLKSNLYLPYIGNTHIAERYGSLNVLDYQAATITNSGTIDTVVELFHGRLVCTSNYDANYFTAESVGAIAERFLARLGELAASVPHAKKPNREVSSPQTGGNAWEIRVRQVAEEVARQPIHASDLNKDIEADLGFDSLELIRIVSRLEHFTGALDRQALLACRTLGEMAASLASSSAPESPDASRDGCDIPYLDIVAQCRKTPDAVAVLWDSGAMSYGELHRQSNKLAHLLREQGVGRGTLVGIMLNRGPNFLVAMLGVLKAGGAYVPLDPDYPAARLSYMLGHSKVDTLLTEQAVGGKLGECLASTSTQALRTLVYLDAPVGVQHRGAKVITRSEWESQPDDDLENLIEADDPMLVLYTSGSTGRPKGVVLAHRGYANRFAWMQRLFQLRAGERVAQKTSICFDISVWEMFWPLMTGATVCTVQTSLLRDPWQLAKWVRDLQINVMHFVPSLFGEFLAAIDRDAQGFPALRQLVFSGEALPVTCVRRWMARFGQDVGLANLYGPTEASIDVTAHLVERMPGAEEMRIPIGHAMENVHLLVLDDAGKPLEPGQVGELWIGGIQLAQGYLNDMERTAESFRPNTFGNIPGKYLYRTGDLATRLPNGEFDYRGRIDTQIKIRGYRVELGEIEAVLCTHPDVQEAGVLALEHGDGHIRLSAWLAGRQVDGGELRDFLKQRLPHYMLPRRFDWLPSLPKNQNGKLDRNALKEYAKGSMQDAEDASSAALDRVIASTASFPVSPAQHWLLTYFKSPYLWAGISRFRYLQPLDIEVFNQALNQLALCHPTLRSVFWLKEGHWHQQFPESGMAIQAEYHDGTHLNENDRRAQMRRLIDKHVDKLRLDEGRPLWAVVIMKEADRRYDISFLGHHIIGDMFSGMQLFKEFWDIYSRLLMDENVRIKAGRPSFVDYLEAVEKEHTRDALSRYVDYWSSCFGGQPAFTVPVDHNRGGNVEASSAKEHFVLAAADYAALQKVRTKQGCGVYPLLLTPLYRLLAEWSGQSRVILSHRTHGRDFGDGRSYFDCIGNFAVNYPMGVTAGEAQAWTEALSDIQCGLDGVPLKGVSYDLAGPHLPAGLYPDNRLTQVRANYLGNRDMRKSALFEFDRDEMDQRFAKPDQERISLIEVVFYSCDGAMHVELDYSRNFHTPETIRRLGERYLALMRSMLAQMAGGVSQPQDKVSSASGIENTVWSSKQPVNPQIFGERGQVAALPLAGKVAIVTGAGRGIGRTLASALAGQGARVALVSRTADQLNEALAETRSISPNAIGIVADITDQEQVEAMVRQVVSQCGGIDILVNNAGVNRSSLLAESDPKEWRHIVDVNLIGTYLCCRSAIPHMIRRGGGKIINLSSAAGVIGYPLFTAYSASKHAVVGLTKALAEELKQQNIQVNAICPAFVDTRMTPQAFRSNSIPTAHVASVVSFLASPHSIGITGESINVFGKQDMYSYGSEKLNLIQAMTKDFKPGIPTWA